MYERYIEDERERERKINEEGQNKRVKGRKEKEIENQTDAGDGTDDEAQKE